MYTSGVPLPVSIATPSWKTVQHLRLRRPPLLDACFLVRQYWNPHRPCQSVEPTRMHLHPLGRIRLLIVLETRPGNPLQTRYVLRPLLRGVGSGRSPSWCRNVSVTVVECYGAVIDVLQPHVGLYHGVAFMQREKKPLERDR